MFAGCGLGCLDVWLLCVLLVARVAYLLPTGLCRVCFTGWVWCCDLVCGLLRSDCLRPLFICVIGGVVLATGLCACRLLGWYDCVMEWWLVCVDDWWLRMVCV